MNVSKRRKITKMITYRTVTHNLIHEGTKYLRTLKIQTEMPYMNMDISINKPKLTWAKYLEGKTIKYLKSSEYTPLEKLFNELDINEKNGN